jgi:thymidylate synthase (FAD)
VKIDLLDKGYIILSDKMGNDLSIVNAARVSYDKESKFRDDGSLTIIDQKLLDFLIREGHTSPFRHASMTFEIYAPLMVARQWWKYAVASTHIDDQNGWNESSRRYITEQEEFYIPNAYSWRSKPENSKQGSGPALNSDMGRDFSNKLFDLVEHGIKLYHEAIDHGVAPELARLFLPAYGMYVRWRWTTSLQGVITFLQQRLPHDAQFEIREYAGAVKQIVQSAFPHSYNAIFKDES